MHERIHPYLGQRGSGFNSSSMLASLAVQVQATLDDPDKPLWQTCWSVGLAHRCTGLKQVNVQVARLMGKLHLYMLIWVRDGVRPVQLHNNIGWLRLQQLRQYCLTGGLLTPRPARSASCIGWTAWHGPEKVNKHKMSQPAVCLFSMHVGLVLLHC